MQNCLLINHTKSVLIRKKIINLENFNRLTKTPFIIYRDFEYYLIPSTDHTDLDPNTKIYQNHIVCSDGCKLICVDVINGYSKPQKLTLVVEMLLTNYKML